MQSMGSIFIHVLTLLHRNLANCQISCWDIEMVKQRLGQARNIFKLGNIFFYHILPQKNPKQLNQNIHEHLRKNILKSERYIYLAIPPLILWPRIGEGMMTNQTYYHMGTRGTGPLLKLDEGKNTVSVLVRGGQYFVQPISIDNILRFWLILTLFRY